MVGVNISRDKQRQETVTQILDSASTLFRAQGFSNTTIRNIAADCNVSVGSVMSVGDKNTLLVASFDQLIKEIHSQRYLQTAIAIDSPADQLITNLFVPFVELFLTHPQLARIYGSILVAGEHESIVFTELSSTLIDEITSVLSTTICPNQAQAFELAESIYFAYIGRLFTWPQTATSNDRQPIQDLQKIVGTICAQQELNS